MRLFLVVLVVCVLLVTAAPGKKDKKKGKKPPRGHGRPDHGPGGRPDNGPGGRPDHGPGGRPEPGHGRHDNGPGGRPEHEQGRPDHGPGGRPDQRPGGRPELGPRPENPWERPSGWRDPRCRNLECPRATRDSYVCGTDGETYDSACYLLQQQCEGRVPTDVEVHFEGRCQHPAEAGEPHGHHGPGRHTPHGHHGPGHHTPHGHHGPGHHTPHGHHGKHPGGRTRGHHDHWHPGGKTPRGHHGHDKHHHDHPHHDHEHHGRHGYRPHWWPRWRPSWWPEECWDIFDDVFNNTDTETTDMPVTVPDYAVDGEIPVGPACTAECPIATTENPLVPVCGTNGKTYESSCVLELVACVTDDYELTVEYEGKCIETPIARLSQRWNL